MKHKLSITLEEDIILRIAEKLRDRRFRNKSHMIEYAVGKFLEEEDGKS